MATAETFVSGIYHPLVGSAFSCFCAAAALGLSQVARELDGTAPREEGENCGLTKEELWRVCSWLATILARPHFGSPAWSRYLSGNPAMLRGGLSPSKSLAGKGTCTGS